MTSKLPVLLDRLGNPLRPSMTSHLGASTSLKEFKTWNPLRESADAELLPELDTLSARSWDLTRNNGYASGGVQTLNDNVVGDAGLRLSARPDYVALGRDKAWADEWAQHVESLYRTWSETTDCDAAGQQNLAAMTSMQYLTALHDGEALALPLWLPKRSDAKYATAIMCIDPVRLSNPNNEPDQEFRRAGIEYNKVGRPVAAWIRSGHPLDRWLFNVQNYRWTRVPMRFKFGRRRVIHLYDKRRVGQTRGKPTLTSVMSSFKMLDHFSKTTLKSAIVNAMVAAFVQTPMGPEGIARMFGGDTSKYISERNRWETEFQGGALIPLFPGDELGSFTPSQPTDVFDPFMTSLLRNVAAGLNMPYELLAKDFSKVNYSSARAALLEAWRFFMGRRNWLAAGWMQPCYELWLEEAISRGEVDAPDYYDNKAAYARAKWIGPGRGWVDPLKEAQAARERMDGMLSTLEKECAEQGLDWREVLEQIAREKALMEELDLTPDQVQQALARQGRAQQTQSADQQQQAAEQQQQEQTS